MIVLLHVLSAISSVVFTTYLYFSPTTNKFRAAYMLIGSTLLSGTYLIVRSHASLISACLSGVIYLGLVTVGLAAAHHKLATDEQDL